MNCAHQMLSLMLFSGMVVSLLEAAAALARRRKMVLCDAIASPLASQLVSQSVGRSVGRSIISFFSIRLSRASTT